MKVKFKHRVPLDEVSLASFQHWTFDIIARVMGAKKTYNRLSLTFSSSSSSSLPPPPPPFLFRFFSHLLFLLFFFFLWVMGGGGACVAGGGGGEGGNAMLEAEGK